MKKWMWILIVSVAIIALFIPYNWLLHGQKIIFHCINVTADKPLSYGELGDFVGGIIGTVVAGIACIMVYLTYKGQCELSEKQQFETTFFNLIHIHKNCLDAIKTSLFLLPDYLPKTSERGERYSCIQTQYEDGDLSDDEIEKHIQHLQGVEAMFEDFNSNTNRDILLPKYYHSPWFNSICMILQYLKDNNKNEKSFYTKYFYSQITRPEWWFLYAIFQNKEKLNSDTEHFNNYVALATDMHFFEFGYYYIVEKSRNIKRDKIYEKNDF